jgi:hypothetical protein
MISVENRVDIFSKIHPFIKGNRFIRAINFSLIVGVALTWSQIVKPIVTLPAPNSSGWIKLTRGNNASDFYTFYSGATIAEGRKTFPDNTFKYIGDTIDVKGTPTGHVIFKQPFSHYRIRYQYRFPEGLGNCGMLIHIQENDPVMWGTFPRSIESQGDPGQGMGQIWAIGQVWVTVHAKSGPQYDPASPEIQYGAEDDNKRMITGIYGYGKPQPAELKLHEWVTQEAEVYGSDSISHYAMNELMIKYRNPRVAPRTNPNQVEKYLKDGVLGWQSEGVHVQYRNIEIKLFPADPLYASLYTTGLESATIREKKTDAPVLEFRDGILRVRPAQLGVGQTNLMGRNLF